MSILSSWRDDAACLGHAPLWDATIDDGGRWGGEDIEARRKRYAFAKSICANCPVAQQCEEDGQVGRDEGVRNAKLMPPLDTVSVRGGKLRVGGGCGTPYGAKAHRSRGEDACDPCLEARRKYDRDYYQRNRRRPA